MLVVVVFSVICGSVYVCGSCECVGFHGGVMVVVFGGCDGYSWGCVGGCGCGCGCGYLCGYVGGVCGIGFLVIRLFSGGGYFGDSCSGGGCVVGVCGGGYRGGYVCLTTVLVASI